MKFVTMQDLLLPDDEDWEDWTTPEGNDDSPDQGVHRF